MSVTKKVYNEARKRLAPHRVEELAMRVVERGAIEFGEKKGARAVRKWFVAELRSRGFKELASYLGKMAPR